MINQFHQISYIQKCLLSDYRRQDKISRPMSCKLTHTHTHRLPETVLSLNHISHHTQCHANSHTHTVYQKQYLHSIIFLITPNVMQTHTLFTRDSAFTQSYFSSHPMSCKLTHTHTVYQKQNLHLIIFPSYLVT